MNITFKLCKNKIEKNMYQTQEDMQLMLDVFFAGERIGADEYQELSDLLKSKQKSA